MAELTIFREFVGDSPTTRLIEFLIEGRAFDWSLTDLATKAGISWKTVSRIFPKLIKTKIVVHTRTIGRAKLYKLNLQNPGVKKLIELFDTLLKQEMERIAAEQEEKIILSE